MFVLLMGCLRPLSEASELFLLKLDIVSSIGSFGGYLTLLIQL
jgi:hypothetical protein